MFHFPFIRSKNTAVTNIKGVISSVEPKSTEDVHRNSLKNTAIGKFYEAMILSPDGFRAIKAELNLLSMRYIESASTTQSCNA